MVENVTLCSYGSVRVLGVTFFLFKGEFCLQMTFQHPTVNFHRDWQKANSDSYCSSTPVPEGLPKQLRNAVAVLFHTSRLRKQEQWEDLCCVTLV